MKFTTKLLALAIASSAAIVPTAFAQSADLSITGRIFPGACTIELGNGGVADLGDIRADTLRETLITPLVPVPLSLSIACESEVRYGLQGTDNTEGSSIGSTSFGLGFTPNDEKIGTANFVIEDVSADAGVAYGTRSTDGGATWTSSSENSQNAISLTAVSGFAKSGGVTTGPAPIKNLEGTLMVQPIIQRRDMLTIVGDVPINGNATLNLIYL